MNELKNELKNDELKKELKNDELKNELKKEFWKGWLIGVGSLTLGVILGLLFGIFLFIRLIK